jgi:hypothetical protein
VAQNIRASIGAGKDAAHATAGSVVGSRPHWKGWNDLVDVGGSAGKGIEQQPPAVELIGDVGSENDAVMRCRDPLREI